MRQARVKTGSDPNKKTNPESMAGEGTGNRSQFRNRYHGQKATAIGSS